MKIVIDISEEQYEIIKECAKKQNDFCPEADSAEKIISRGMPLPKGHERKFEEIVIEYPPAELCTYPEYKGKPYFLIKYEENGEHIIGFGTYNLEVLSEYLREYFIKPIATETENEEDEYSRKISYMRRKTEKIRSVIKANKGEEE